MLDDELTYVDLYEAALEEPSAERALRALRVLEHLKAMAGATFIKRKLDAMEARRKASGRAK